MPSPNAFVQIPPDSTGKQLACFSFAGGLLGHAQVLVDDAGNELGVAANPVRTDPTGTTTQPVSAAALPLPTGAATAANQTTEIAGLASIDGRLAGTLTVQGSVGIVGNVEIVNDVGNPIPVSGTFWQATQPVSGAFFQATQPISAAALPLPAGAAQEAGNLATIAGKDFATQATLALVKAKTDNLDVALSTVATQATLAAIKLKTDNLPADPAREGGVLATAANQATLHTDLALIDTDMVARAGEVAEIPNPYTHLGRLVKLSKQLDTLTAVVAKAPPPPARPKAFSLLTFRGF